jgi:hypothetical protein
MSSHGTACRTEMREASEAENCGGLLVMNATGCQCGTRLRSLWEVFWYSFRWLFGFIGWNLVSE